jgi:hypothetical protein
VETSDPSSLTVTTAASFAGALVLDVNISWTNADGTAGSMYVADNVEAYAPGSPIFAVSADDHLTGSSGSDLFVFAQPIASDVIHNFNVVADKIDLIGFSGVNGYADLSIVNDANGNAVVTAGAGQTITVLGVDASVLSEGNFVFNHEPVMSNTGTMTISDGAILPLGGIVDNSGSIMLGSTGSETHLEILVESVTLQGGGQVILSDDSHNVIFGGAANATLINMDNTISGAGHVGDGQMTLVNSGMIIADGANALVIDTGSNAITNSGMLEATGSGGLFIASDVSNIDSGLLWANGGNIVLNGSVDGGSALIDGHATLDFEGAASTDVILSDTASGTIKIADSDQFTGSVTGLSADDVLDLGDMDLSQLLISYAANAQGTGGTLTVTDGVDTANIELVGQYQAAGFKSAADVMGGVLVTYDPAQNPNP